MFNVIIKIITGNFGPLRGGTFKFSPHRVPVLRCMAEFEVVLDLLVPDEYKFLARDRHHEVEVEARHATDKEELEAGEFELDQVDSVVVREYDKESQER